MNRQRKTKSGKGRSRPQNKQALVLRNQKRNQNPKFNPIRRSKKLNLYSRPNQFGAMVAYSSKVGQLGKPQIINSVNNSIRVRNCERVMTLTATDTNSHLIEFPIQPGIGSAFTWLSGVANNYETYVINNLQIRYVSTTNSTNIGSVIMAFDYDANDPAPSDSDALSLYNGNVTCSVWEKQALRFNNNNNRIYNKHYVRAGLANVNVDLKTYDSANFFMFYKSTTQGDFGYLYADYDITLYTPQANTISGGTLGVDNLQDGVDDTHLFGTTWENAEITGTLPVSYSSGNILKFNRPWTGFIAIQTTQTSVTSLTATGTLGALLGPSYVLANAGTTEYVIMFAVLAKYNSIITFTNVALNALTVTYVNFGQVSPYGQVNTGNV